MNKLEKKLMSWAVILIVFMAGTPALLKVYRAAVANWQQHHLKQQQEGAKLQKQELAEKARMLIGAWQSSNNKIGQPFKFSSDGYCERRVFYRNGIYNEFTWQLTWDKIRKQYTMLKYSFPANRETFHYKVQEKPKGDYYRVRVWSPRQIALYGRGLRPGQEFEFYERTLRIRIFPDKLEIAPPAGSKKLGWETWHRIPVKGSDQLKDTEVKLLL